MKSKITLQNMPEGYEVCGIGASPEEDSLVVMSSEAIRKLRKPGFFSRLFSGPVEIAGTGASPMESDFIDEAFVRRTSN